MTTERDAADFLRFFKGQDKLDEHDASEMRSALRDRGMMPHAIEDLRQQEVIDKYINLLEEQESRGIRDTPALREIQEAKNPPHAYRRVRGF